MIIDPDLLDKFNRNALSNAEMRQVEATMLQYHVANASFSTLMQEYHSRTDVDELIGEDEESDTSFGERSKIISEKCKKNDVPASIETNIKIQQIMNNMNITNEDMARIANRQQAISVAHESNLTLNENLSVAYRAAHPELSEEAANAVVAKLIKGCNDLTNRYRQAIAEGFDAETEISNLTRGMDVETRFNFLINALAAVEALNSGAYASQTDAENAIRKAVEDFLAATPTPTEGDCDAIQKLLAESIANNTLILTGSDQAHELLEKAKDTNSVIDFASERYDDARTKAEMALAMWLEYEDGNLTSIPEGATPEAIGIGAATAVEEAKIMNDVATGRATADKAVKWLKILGGIALVLLLGYVGLMVAALVGELAATALLSVFGTSAIACFATMALCLPLFWGCAHLGLKAGAIILDKAGKAFDVVVKTLRETIIPKIKEIAANIIAWFKRKLAGRQSSAETSIITA